MYVPINVCTYIDCIPLSDSNSAVDAIEDDNGNDHDEEVGKTNVDVLEEVKK